jgi:hypothetical protein
MDREEIRDFGVIKGSIERLENHFKVYKDDMLDVKDAIKDLRTAIVGNNINGNKGFIHVLDRISDKVEALENENILLKEHMKAIKYVAGVLFTALIGSLFIILRK